MDPKLYSSESFYPVLIKQEMFCCRRHYFCVSQSGHVLQIIRFSICTFDTFMVNSAHVAIKPTHKWDLSVTVNMEEKPSHIVRLITKHVWCCRYKPPSTESNPTLEDPTPDYMNLLGMIFSMCGLMLKVTYTHAHTYTHNLTLNLSGSHLPQKGKPCSSPFIPFRRLKVNSPSQWKDEGQLLALLRTRWTKEGSSGLMQPLSPIVDYLFNCLSMNRELF